MKIFLSYPAEERAVAERMNLALLAHGHDVFFDRADLAAGLEYDRAIARAVDESEVMIFLITPASVAAGRYTRTELHLAERKWPHPSGRVLPVLLRETPTEAVPAYLRAVNFLVPRGDVVAETAQEADRLARAVPLVSRARRILRSRRGVVAVLIALVAAAAVWIAAPRQRASTITWLPDDVRQRARGVAAAADGGYVVAAAEPSQIVRFSPDGARVGEPIALTGEPTAVARTPTQIMVVTRAPDGVTVLDWNDLRVIDTVRLDPARVKAPPDVESIPRVSGDIQSVAVGGPRIPMLWAVTGERDGAAAVLRYRSWERQWEVASWSLKPEGLVGGDARGLKLRLVGTDLWAVTAATTPSGLLHMVGAIRVDEFRGHDHRMVSCARDVAASATGTLLFLSCDNELQEVSADGKQLTLVRVRPTLPRESAAGHRTDEIIVVDGSAAIVALNTEAGLPDNRPSHARIAEIDTSGTVKTLLDLRDAVVRSLAVTPTWAVAVLRRADGRFDAVRVARPR